MGRSKFEKIRAFKVDYFDFSCKKIELDVRVFSNLFQSNLFIFELKLEKIFMGVFSTHFVPLISILAPTIMEE